MTTAALSQSRFRGRSDAGTVDAAPTWIAAESTNFSWAAGTNFRIRIGVQETAGGNPAAATVKLQYSKNAGAYADVTTSSSNVIAVDAGSSVEDTSIATQRLSGTGTYVAGRYSEDGSPATNVDLAANNNTEWEFGIRIVAADVASGDTIDLKVVALSGTSITATTVPRVTVLLNKSLTIDAGSYTVSGQTVSVEHRWIVAADAGSYSVAGQDVGLEKGLPIIVDAGLYSISGQDVALQHAWIIVSDNGSYAITGQDVLPLVGFAVAIGSGSYVISGQDVSLDYAAASNRAIVSWAAISFGVDESATGADMAWLYTVRRRRYWRY